MRTEQRSVAGSGSTIAGRWCANRFSQLVLQDDFGDGRPPREDVGVQLVTDAAPYEPMKLRLLKATRLIAAIASRVRLTEGIDEHGRPIQVVNPGERLADGQGPPPTAGAHSVRGRPRRLGRSRGR